VKKLFALLAVAALAAVGCDDKKSTGKPSNATTGGTYVKTDTVRHDVTTHVTNTVELHTAVETRLHTAATTVTKPGDKGPAVPPAGSNGNKGKGDK
jgi:hypothetical protein